jgi:phosphotransferase system HPr-like phosphotransfer protein
MRIELDQSNTDKLLVASRATGNSVNNMVNRIIDGMDENDIVEKIIELIKKENGKRKLEVIKK